MTGSNKSAVVILAPGSEEMEAVITIDVLRRAEVRVTVAGLNGKEPVTCSRGVNLQPDCALSDLQAEFDAVILPGGGPGAQALADSERVGELLRRQWQRGGIVAAICAAPLALLKHQIGLGSPITHFPGLEAKLAPAFVLTGEQVTVAGNLITGKGPGASFEFALALVAQLCGQQRADATRAPLQLP